MKYLIIVDMQKDFINGALGTPEAVGIVSAVKKYAEAFDGEIIFTRDTHFEDYAETQEGKNLPVTHCIKGTEGWNCRSLFGVALFRSPSSKVFVLQATMRCLTEYFSIRSEISRR